LWSKTQKRKLKKSKSVLIIQAHDKPVGVKPGVRDAEVPAGADPEGAALAWVLAAQDAWALAGLDEGQTFVDGVHDALAYPDAVHPAWTDVAPGGLGGTPFDQGGIQADPDAVRVALDESQEEALDAAPRATDEDLDVDRALGEDLTEKGNHRFYFFIIHYRKICFLQVQATKSLFINN
jgi:hypothetical protein